MSAASAAVDVYDRAVDIFRSVCGWPPLPPLLLKAEFESAPTVRVGTALIIEYRRAVYGFGRVEQDGANLFEGAIPADGRIGVMPLTPAPIHVHVNLESRDPMARHGISVTEVTFEPLPNGPAVERFDAPEHAALGDSIACAWSAPRAGRVRLTMIEQNNVTDNIGPSIGQILLPPPTRPGLVFLRLTAEAEWGQRIETRAVNVAAPELRLDLLRPPLQYGEPGQSLTFEWRTVGADGVWLIEPDAPEPRKLDDKDGGLIVVMLGMEPVEFEVIAKGYGGAEQSAVLRAVPYAFASLETGL